MALCNEFRKVFEFALFADLEAFGELDFLNAKENFLKFIEAPVNLTEKIEDRRSGYWPFKVARVYARRLKKKNVAEWREYAKSKQRIRKIPTNPQKTYKNEWKNWDDWLGRNDEKGMSRLKEYVRLHRTANVPYGYRNRDGFKLGEYVEELRRTYTDDPDTQEYRELFLSDTDFPEDVLREHESRHDELCDLPDWHWELRDPVRTIVEVDGPTPQVVEDLCDLKDDLRELISQSAPDDFDYMHPETQTDIDQEKTWFGLSLKKRICRGENGGVVQIKGTFKDLVLNETFRHLQTARVEKCVVCTKLFLCEKETAHCSHACYQKEYPRTLEDYQKLAEEFGGHSLSTGYVSSNQALQWKCAEGHEWRAKLGDVRKGIWCPMCGVSPSNLANILFGDG